MLHKYSLMAMVNVLNSYDANKGSIFTIHLFSLPNVLDEQSESRASIQSLLIVRFLQLPCSYIFTQSTPHYT